MIKNTSLKSLMKKHKIIRIAFSSGKDSSCVMHLVLCMAIELKLEGFTVPKILVTTSDTGVENPVVSAQVKLDHEAIKQFGLDNGIDIVTKIVRPNLSSSFYGRTLATGVIPAYGNMNRSCTDAWKITPQKSFVREFLKSEGLNKTDMITVIGSRNSESSGRKVRMEKQGISEGKTSESDGYAVMAPIYNWTTDDVFIFLSEIENGFREKTYSNMSRVISLYKDANGECPIIKDNLTKNAKACGARFGCFMCVAGSVAGTEPHSITGDKSLETMIAQEVNGIRPYEYLKPLADIQRFLASIQYDYSKRSFIGRKVVTGKKGSHSDYESYLKIEPGIFNGESMIQLLEYILTAQADEAEHAAKNNTEPRFELITVEELVYIDARQSMNGLTPSHATIDAYHRIVNLHERYYPEHYTETFVPRSPKQKTKYIKLDYIADVELMHFDSECLCEDAGLETEELNDDAFYSVSESIVDWVKRDGAAELSAKFQKYSTKESRCSSFYFWNNSGVKVSRRVLNLAHERLVLTEAIEMQGLHDIHHEELYKMAIELYCDNKDKLNPLKDIAVDISTKQSKGYIDKKTKLSFSQLELFEQKIAV